MKTPCISKLGTMTASALLLSSLVISGSAIAAQHEDVATKGEVCEGFGPQTPRDIDSVAGTNSVKFNLAPPSTEMNLCNIHFHNNAEHKAKAFSVYAGDGDHGYGGGYQCGISQSLTEAELKVPDAKICKNLKPGDTIEVHWVHSSCDVAPGPGLGSCLSEKCANPDLRVETQVFTLVNDASALNFNDLTKVTSDQPSGYYQAKGIPSTTGEPIQFAGSTTGPSYTELACSALQVTWSVRPACAKLDINTLGKWCESNEFGEEKAHGVRELVTDKRLLSPIE